MKKLRQLMMKKPAKYILKTIKVILTIIIVCILAVIIVQKVSNNSINLGGYGIYTVVTGSMEPELDVRDMILAKRASGVEYDVGDIIIYNGTESSFKDKLITHRVISKERKNNKLYYTVKGDANYVEDPEISSDQVIGKVITKLAVLSLLSRILSNPFGFFFMIFVPFVVFAFISFIDIKKELEEVNSECEDSEKKED